MRVGETSGCATMSMLCIVLSQLWMVPTAVACERRDAAAQQTPSTQAQSSADVDEPECTPPADPAAAEAATEPGLAKRVLREREVLGTQFRGHLFVDGLPIGPDGAQIGKALELRRFRVSFARGMAFRWEAIGAAELASGRLELKDLYFRKHFDVLGTVTLGNQSEPMGLDELTSQLARPLLEPSMATALAPGRNFGIVVGNRYGNLHYQAGVFGAGTLQEGLRDLGTAFTGRLTHRTIDASGEVRHLGFALGVRQLTGTESFRSVPEVGIDQEFLVDTGIIENAVSTRRGAIEYIETFGRWSIRAELMRTRVERDLGPDLRFGGGFVEAGWVAWGEGERYDDGKAMTSRAPLRTSAEWGDAWGRGNLTLTARLSRLDLSDDDIQGGSETNLSFGAAWDLGERTRIAANLVRFVELTGPNARAEDSLALAIRLQYAW